MREIADQYAGPLFWSSVRRLAADSGTPFYLYFPERAEIAYKLFTSGLAKWGTGQVAFSVKTNPLRPLLQDLKEWGAFAEVVSTWELRHAVAVGFRPEDVIVNGPLKTKADLEEIRSHHTAVVNVDSLDELATVEVVAEGHGRMRVGVRLCPPRDGDESWSRFGVDVSSGELDEAIARIRRSDFLELGCIHFHLGTQIREVQRYSAMVMLARELWSRYRFEPQVWLDIGGGFPYDHAVPFEEQTFRPAEFFSNLANAWGTTTRPAILAEPGRFVAAPAMATVSQVLAHKARRGEPTIVVLDSGTNHNVMAAFYEHSWSCHEASAHSLSHRFCGPLCMEDDILSGTRSGPIPKVGSLVAAFNAGAYSIGLARPFIQPRPSVFGMRSDGSTALLQQRENLEDAYLFGRQHAARGIGAEGA